MNDLISRQDAIDAVKEYFMFSPREGRECAKAIERVPSVQPRKGKWIQNDNGTWSCNQCNSWIPDEQHYYANWCLYCGADMREG